MNQIYPEYTTHYPLLIKSLTKRALDLYPDDIAIVYRNDAGQYMRFTWRQWYERTSQLAHALKSLGIKPGAAFQPGDRVATMALNHHRHMENIYASTMSGAISHPINIRLSLDHMAYTITHAEDKVIFFDDTVMPLVETLYDRIKPKVQTFVYMSDKPGLPKTRIQPLYEYEELIKSQPKTYDWLDFSEDTYAVLYYTTGTTGLPKGAMYTHRQIVLQTIYTVRRWAIVSGCQTTPFRRTPPCPWSMSLCSTFMPGVRLSIWYFRRQKWCSPAGSARRASASWCKLKK